jgi:hypothetical protein
LINCWETNLCVSRRQWVKVVRGVISSGHVGR